MYKNGVNDTDIDCLIELLHIAIYKTFKKYVPRF